MESGSSSSPIARSSRAVPAVDAVAPQRTLPRPARRTCDAAGADRGRGPAELTGPPSPASRCCRSHPRSPYPAGRRRRTAPPLLPQQRTLPSSSTAHVCASPALIAVAVRFAPDRSARAGPEPRRRRSWPRRRSRGARPRRIPSQHAPVLSTAQVCAPPAVIATPYALGRGSRARPSRAFRRRRCCASWRRPRRPSPLNPQQRTLPSSSSAQVSNSPALIAVAKHPDKVEADRRAGGSSSPMLARVAVSRSPLQGAPSGGPRRVQRAGLLPVHGVDLAGRGNNSSKGLLTGETAVGRGGGTRTIGDAGTGAGTMSPSTIDTTPRRTPAGVPERTTAVVMAAAQLASPLHEPGRTVAVRSTV